MMTTLKRKKTSHDRCIGHDSRTVNRTYSTTSQAEQGKTGFSRFNNLISVALGIANRSDPPHIKRLKREIREAAISLHEIMSNGKSTKRNIVMAAVARYRETLGKLAREIPRIPIDRLEMELIGYHMPEAQTPNSKNGNGTENKHEKMMGKHKLVASESIGLVRGELDNEPDKKTGALYSIEADGTRIRVGGHGEIQLERPTGSEQESMQTEIIELRKQLERDAHRLNIVLSQDGISLQQVENAKMQFEKKVSKLAAYYPQEKIGDIIPKRVRRTLERADRIIVAYLEKELNEKGLVLARLLNNLNSDISDIARIGEEINSLVGGFIINEHGILVSGTDAYYGRMEEYLPKEEILRRMTTETKLAFFTYLRVTRYIKIYYINSNIDVPSDCYEATLTTGRAVMGGYMGLNARQTDALEIAELQSQIEDQLAQAPVNSPGGTITPEPTDPREIVEQMWENSYNGSHRVNAPMAAAIPEDQVVQIKMKRVERQDVDIENTPEEREELVEAIEALCNIDTLMNADGGNLVVIKRRFAKAFDTVLEETPGVVVPKTRVAIITDDGKNIQHFICQMFKDKNNRYLVVSYVIEETGKLRPEIYYLDPSRNSWQILTNVWDRYEESRTPTLPMEMQIMLDRELIEHIRFESKTIQMHPARIFLNDDSENAVREEWEDSRDLLEGKGTGRISILERHKVEGFLRMIEQYGFAPAFDNGETVTCDAYSPELGQFKRVAMPSSNGKIRYIFNITTDGTMLATVEDLNDEIIATGRVQNAQLEWFFERIEISEREKLSIFEKANSKFAVITEALKRSHEN